MGKPGKVYRRLMPGESAPLAFMNRMKPLPNGCWVVQGRWSVRSRYSLNTGVSGKSMSVARYSYELFVSPIPAGLHIDHLCRFHWCVHPDHLDPVTPSINLRRMMAARKIRLSARTCAVCCSPLTDPNLMFTRIGTVTCRACGTPCYFDERLIFTA